MERLLLDIRRSPAAYLSSRGISSQDLVEELLQVRLGRKSPHTSTQAQNNKLPISRS